MGGTGKKVNYWEDKELTVSVPVLVYGILFLLPVEIISTLAIREKAYRNISKAQTLRQENLAMATGAVKLQQGILVYIPQDEANITQARQGFPGTVVCPAEVAQYIGQQPESNQLQQNHKLGPLEKLYRTEAKTLGFVASGSVAVSAVKHRNSNLVKCSLGMNLISAVMSSIGIILFTAELALTYSSLQKHASPLIMSLGQGLCILFYLFTLLQFCITVLASHFECQTACCNKDTAMSFASYTMIDDGLMPTESNPAPPGSCSWLVLFRLGLFCLASPSSAAPCPFCSVFTTLLLVIISWLATPTSSLNPFQQRGGPQGVVTVGLFPSGLSTLTLCFEGSLPFQIQQAGDILELDLGIFSLSGTLPLRTPMETMQLVSPSNANNLQTVQGISANFVQPPASIKSVQYVQYQGSPGNPPQQFPQLGALGKAVLRNAKPLGVRIFAYILVPDDFKGSSACILWMGKRIV
ncbi:Membrane-spanning 4-domains subfamily A member 8 [Varanus komodoensis]|nr:Membrane-spanning 4-domains subfamily A member 8 [Varanus komodoensis]